MWLVRTGLLHSSRKASCSFLQIVVIITKISVECNVRKLDNLCGHTVDKVAVVANKSRVPNQKSIRAFSSTSLLSMSRVVGRLIPRDEEVIWLFHRQQ